MMISKDAGEFISLDAAGKVHVSYHDTTNKDLKHATNKLTDTSISSQSIKLPSAGHAFRNSTQNPEGSSLAHLTIVDYSRHARN